MGLKDYLALIKPKVIWLLVLSAVAGYVIASSGSVNPIKLIELILVGLLSTGGAAAFNMYYERDIDALMSRTRGRPLPSGRVTPQSALAESLTLSTAGFALSAAWLGTIPTLFVIAGWISYAILYTVILKCRSWVNILIGGFAGNASLLTGWTTAAPLSLEAILISMAIYIWIPSHIWSLVIRARDDYSKTCIKMLPLVVSERSAIIIVSMMNAVSSIYMLALYLAIMHNTIGTVVLGIATAYSMYYSVRSISRPSPEAFWSMFKASSPLLTIFLIIIALTAVLG